MVSVMGKRGLFLVWLCLVNILPGMAQTEKLIDYVNPFCLLYTSDAADE